MFAAPDDALTVLTRDLGILIGLVALAGLLRPERAAHRVLFGALTASLVLTYASWRWLDTLPRLDLTLESLWPHTYFALEAVAITYTLLSIVILFRQVDHSRDADVAERVLTARLLAGRRHLHLHLQRAPRGAGDVDPAGARS